LRQFAGMSGVEVQAEVGLPPQSPLSLIDRYLIALQIEYLGSPPRKKQKNNSRATAQVWARHIAQGYVPPSVADYGMQSSLPSQASNIIAGTSNEQPRSLNSSPPGPKYLSTTELAGTPSRATEERDEKQTRFQEELLAEMRKQTAVVEEMVQVVKELYRSARA